MKRIRLENPDITPAELEMKAREEVSTKAAKTQWEYLARACFEKNGFKVSHLKRRTLANSARFQNKKRVDVVVISPSFESFS